MKFSSLPLAALVLLSSAGWCQAPATSTPPVGLHDHQIVSEPQTTSDKFGDLFEIEARLAGSTTDNLSKDWHPSRDRWETGGLTLRFYPLRWAEFKFVSEYTAYRYALPLCNFSGQAGVTIIPTRADSRTNVYFSANVKGQDYREMEIEDTGAGTAQVNRNDYPNRSYDLLLSVDHLLWRSIRVRSGFQFKVTGYDASSLHDRYEHQLFVGGNMALTGSTALDIEGGYRFGDYYHLVDSTERGTAFRLRNLTRSSFVPDNLEWFYFSPRLSQSVGRRTGLSVTYLYRNFVRLEPNAFIWGNSVYVWNGSHTITDGMTISLISPWASIYEGNTVTLKAKTYLIPKVTLSASFGYADKTFLTAHDGWYYNPRAAESDSLPIVMATPSTLHVKGSEGYHHDVERRYNVTLLVPIPSHSGYYIEPSLKIDYSDVDSNKPWYSYTAFGVSGELKVRF